ncbi:MAG: hypothetical protein BWY42_01179 [Candidatus Omnitrophica bacterium ADurb.Bin277]|nr:MAG: hypothetical protein BWY42_01179 [Candidatus Omnitrophica bacterium ADurb.Bin277]
MDIAIKKHLADLFFGVGEFHRKFGPFTMRKIGEKNAASGSGVPKIRLLEPVLKKIVGNLVSDIASEPFLDIFIGQIRCRFKAESLFKPAGKIAKIEQINFAAFFINAIIGKHASKISVHHAAPEHLDHESFKLIQDPLLGFKIAFPVQILQILVKRSDLLLDNGNICLPERSVLHFVNEFLFIFFGRINDKGRHRDVFEAQAGQINKSILPIDLDRPLFSKVIVSFDDVVEIIV